ncbi:MAG TPA: 2-C-methyl-D-erythritol 4-phosphate cytidylyltransferase [Steroidobacteraceae bacterium]|nr:2-C-methyl-D-erythritol 4-phosphate cytidylyltransferase [Steroidobacteraceae bacterium]
MTPVRAPRRVWAIVPAAGRGTRFSTGTDASGAATAATATSGAATSAAADPVPKQYAPLLGATVLEWTLRRLLAEPRLHAVVAVVAGDDARWPIVAAKLDAPKLESAIGGASRQQSVINGLAHLDGRAAPRDWVLVHDAARPCLTSRELEDLLDALDRGAEGAVLGAPLVDTIKREQDGVIAQTVDRQGLWRALTPQVFEFAALRAALQEAERLGLTVTDEAQAMERLGHHPALVAGSPFNIKVTRTADLEAAAKILRSAEATSMRIGQGFDVHAFGAGDHVVLGGVSIPYARGVLAHSDGDVIIHALCDAVLGALGLGDIGQHFPDSDPKYRGADSRVFLREVAAHMRSAGLTLVNADVTVLAEGPRIAKHRLAMAANLAQDLGVEPARINIKATTAERLGSIGRGEGLAAFAAVLLDA